MCLPFTFQRHSQGGSMLSSSLYCSESPDPLQSVEIINYIVYCDLSLVQTILMSVSIDCLYVCPSVCPSVCLLLRSHISKTTHANFTKFSAHVACSRGSVLFQRRCYILCTCGSVNDVVFSYTGWSKKTRPLYIFPNI